MQYCLFYNDRPTERAEKLSAAASYIEGVLRREISRTWAWTVVGLVLAATPGWLLSSFFYVPIARLALAYWWALAPATLWRSRKRSSCFGFMENTA